MPVLLGGRRSLTTVLRFCQMVHDVFSLRSGDHHPRRERHRPAAGRPVCWFGPGAGGDDAIRHVIEDCPIRRPTSIRKGTATPRWHRAASRREPLQGNRRCVLLIFRRDGPRDMIRHLVEVIHMPGDARVTDLEASVREALQSHGLHLTVEVELVPASAAAEPEITLFFGSHVAATDDDCNVQLERALQQHRLVVPILEQHQAVDESVPHALLGHNALIMGNSVGHHDAARLVLEELGIEDSQRRVFISHRAVADALQMAEQLHDESRVVI